MKKSVLASLLALATIFPGSVSMVYAQAAQSGQITIKDPAEYNAYTNAVGQSTPAAKAAAIEAFLTQYPNSVVKNDMLEQLMVAYQGDPVKMLDAADRLLAVDPEICGLWPQRFTWRRLRPTPRPIQPTPSPSSIKPLPRHRPASAPRSRPPWRRPTIKS